jgi:hypothetical protein
VELLRRGGTVSVFGGILVGYLPVSVWGYLKDTEGRGGEGDATTICLLRQWIAGEGFGPIRCRGLFARVWMMGEGVWL